MIADFIMFFLMALCGYVVGFHHGKWGEWSKYTKWRNGYVLTDEFTKLALPQKLAVMEFIDYLRKHQ